jgi:hypothetical protein
MSSLFDIDETTEVVIKKKAPKAETTTVAETSAVVEPKIVASIRKTVTKLLEINKIAKRSVIISKTMSKLFDENEADLDAQYGSVNITIDTMVQENDVQEITLLDGDDNPIESVLFAKNLTLDIDFDSAPLPGTDDEEEDPTAGETHIPGLTDFDRELSEFESQAEAQDMESLEFSNSDVRATLNDKVEMFAVVSTAGENQTVVLVEDAIEAVHSQREAAKYEGVSSKVYGLIPVEVHTSLGFANSAVDAGSELEEDIAGIPDDDEDGELNLDGPIGPDAEGDSASPSDSSVFDEEEPK